MSLKMFSKLLTVIVLATCASAQYFKTQGRKFLYDPNGDVENNGVDFGKFAAVNLGVTNPGYQPGQVVLRKQDYLERFERLKALGVNVIRVYALLHPEFYETLLEWNENNSHTIYVFHGTAFPEYEMEGLDDNGDCTVGRKDGDNCLADVFDPETNINTRMRQYIERTVKGVYGEGEAIYITKTGKTEMYTANIAKYLMGWLISGEIPPTCVTETNERETGECEETDSCKFVNEAYMTMDSYDNINDGIIEGDKNELVKINETSATPFEYWISKMLDYTAQQITSYGYSTPLSHTNWVTTDGIKNFVEPRVSSRENSTYYTQSIEDWEEIDFTKMLYEGIYGYYNQHAYPYYPNLVQEKQGTNQDDPFVDYIKRLEEKYSDLPFMITEIGISTSLGVASRDENFGRNHGGVKQADQGRIMAELMNKVISDETETMGIMIFQLHDEWFKKSWNTRIFEPKERQTWLNVLSAEQGFGIFETKPDETKLKFEDINSKDSNLYLKKMSITHDSAYVHIKIKISDEITKSQKIVVGIDSIRNAGTKKIIELENGDRISHQFDNDIESLVVIDTEAETVNFQQLQSITPFARNYAEWLTFDEDVNYKESFCSDECFTRAEERENGEIDFTKRGSNGNLNGIGMCDICTDYTVFGGDGISIYDRKPEQGKFIDWKMLVRAPLFVFPNMTLEDWQGLEAMDDDTRRATVRYGNTSELNKYNLNKYIEPICYNDNGEIKKINQSIVCDPNSTAGCNRCDEDGTNWRQAGATNIDAGFFDNFLPEEIEEQPIYKPHTTWTFQPNEEDKTFAINGDEYHVKLPWSILGYTIPGYHKQYIQSDEIGKEYNADLNSNKDGVIVKSGINFETIVLSGATTIENTEIKTNYQWKGWDQPEHYCIKAKESFNDFRDVFHKINGLEKGDITQAEIDALTTCFSIEKGHFSIHKWVVIACILFLASMFFLGAFGALIQKHIMYCYSYQRSDLELESSSYRLKFVNFILLAALAPILFLELEISDPELTTLYIIWLVLIIWDPILIFIGMIIHKWNLYEKKNMPVYDANKHAFVISCHNSSDVVENTLRSLLSKVRPNTIFVGDNGSTPEEQEATNNICYRLSYEYCKNNDLPFIEENMINYGHSPMGNKTIAQYASVCNLPDYVEFVTCIDDDTRLHETWEVQKVIHYFKDENVAVLAYPLKAEKPKFDVELFQAIEYIIAGFTKIWHSKIWSTIFNSGAFGTYRVEILKEAFQNHNTDFNGDDLQICLNIHQLKGNAYLTIPDKKHTKDYRVLAATDMIVSTIVPKCFFHLKSISPTLFKNAENCTCDNPDLFKQRSKGWFVSKHRFIPKYLKMIFNCKGSRGIWVRLVALYELLIILNEYFILVYVALLLRSYGWWMMEAFIIGIAVNVFSMLLFNQVVLKRNKLGIPMEAITIQPLVYKIFMITIYRYCGLFYNMFCYLPKHRSGKLIKERVKDENFTNMIDEMYVRRPASIEQSLLKNDQLDINQVDINEVDKVELQIVDNNEDIELQARAADPNEPIEIVVTNQ